MVADALRAIEYATRQGLAGLALCMALGRSTDAGDASAVLVPKRLTRPHHARFGYCARLSPLMLRRSHRPDAHACLLDALEHPAAAVVGVFCRGALLDAGSHWR